MVNYFQIRMIIVDTKSAWKYKQNSLHSSAWVTICSGKFKTLPPENRIIYRYGFWCSVRCELDMNTDAEYETIFAKIFVIMQRSFLQLNYGLSWNTNKTFNPESLKSCDHIQEEMRYLKNETAQLLIAVISIFIYIFV